MKTLQDRIVWARSMKSQRDRMEFTQQDLAEKAGVSQGAIAHLESGRTKTSRSLVAIAEALGVQPRWLAENKGVPFSEGSPEYARAIEHIARPGAMEQVPTPTPAPPEKKISLIWADSDDLTLLTLFHGTDDEGREKILRTAHRVPRVIPVASVGNQS